MHSALVLSRKIPNSVRGINVSWLSYFDILKYVYRASPIFIYLFISFKNGINLVGWHPKKLVEYINYLIYLTRFFSVFFSLLKSKVRTLKSPWIWNWPTNNHNEYENDGILLKTTKPWEKIKMKRKKPALFIFLVVQSSTELEQNFKWIKRVR